MSDYENFQSIQYQAESEPQIYKGGSMRQLGGVTEYSVAPDMGNFQPLVQTPAIRAYGNEVTTINADGSTHSGGITTVNTGSLSAGQSDFLATARNHGFAAMGNLTGDTTVRFQGMEVTLDTLVALGEVRKTADGRFEAVNGGGSTGGAQRPAQGNQGSFTEAPANDQQQLPAGVELFDAGTEANVMKALQPVPQSYYDATVALVLEKGLEGVNWQDAAQASGMSPQDAQARAQVVFKAFTAQADNLAKSAGIDNPTEVWDYLAENHRDAFQNARLQMAFGRNTAALKGLVGEYFRNVPPTVEALKRGGFATSTGQDGEPVVKLGGVWMSTSAAARAGLI